MEEKERKVIYIGSHYPVTIKEDLLNRHSGVDFPADNLQQSILKGFDENGIQPIAISYLNITPWPKIGFCHFHPCLFSRRGDGQQTDLYIGGINVPFLSRIYNCVKLVRYLKKSSSKQEKKDLVVYALSSHILFAIWMNRKRYGTKTVIVPDLPEYMSENKSLLYRAAKALDKRVIDFFIKNAIDKFVLLSPYMRERLPIGDKPWMQMEGIFSSNEIIERKEKKNKIILYTGKMDKRYGIADLLDAFGMIEDETYQLWLRGGGECKQLALERAKSDKRIRVLDRMSRKELLNTQAAATVLINPVRPSQTFTRYFFPSKTMEYLASGTPTIMYRLACLPQEYCEFIYFVEEETVQSLYETLIRVCSKPQEELEQFGQRASNFIIERKNPKAQIGSVINFIYNEDNL
jgi:glycosyltransferase involved in cell wall biosynthesis